MIMMKRTGDGKEVMELQVAAMGFLWEAAAYIKKTELPTNEEEVRDMVNRLKEVVADLKAVTAVEKRMFPYLKRTAVVP